MGMEFDQGDLEIIEVALEMYVDHMSSLANAAEEFLEPPDLTKTVAEIRKAANHATYIHDKVTGHLDGGK